LGRFFVVQACFRVRGVPETREGSKLLPLQVVLTYMYAQRIAAASAYNIQGKVFSLFDKLQYTVQHPCPADCRIGRVLQRWFLRLCSGWRSRSDLACGGTPGKALRVKDARTDADAVRHAARQGVARRKREFVDAAAGRCHGALVLFFGGTPDGW
jgi:hypothetical protein